MATMAAATPPRRNGRARRVSAPHARFRQLNADRFQPLALYEGGQPLTEHEISSSSKATAAGRKAPICFIPEALSTPTRVGVAGLAGLASHKMFEHPESLLRLHAAGVAIAPPASSPRTGLAKLAAVAACAKKNKTSARGRKHIWTKKKKTKSKKNKKNKNKKNKNKKNKNKNKRKIWSVDEDIWLRLEIDALVPNHRDMLDRRWNEISSEIAKKHPEAFARSGKQCRERWRNHLNPLIDMGEIDPDEDTKILDLVELVGKKWRHIAEALPKCRSGNRIKNRWYNGIKLKERFAKEGRKMPSKEEASEGLVVLGAKDAASTAKKPPPAGKKKRKRVFSALEATKCATKVRKTLPRRSRPTSMLQKKGAAQRAGSSSVS